MADVLFCGVEGGGSHSTTVLCNGLGKILSWVEGPGTNVWQIGMEETRDRIITMTMEAKKKAGLSQDASIKSICMSLSGAESLKTNQEFQAKFEGTGLAEDYVVCSDTRGPIAAADEAGGVVLIAGTGSNGLLINPDGSEVRCGGWGYILGDEGSAYSISHKAIKVYFDDEDGLQKAPCGYATDVLWATIQDFFNVKTRLEILPHIYTKFEKDEFSRLCKKLSEEAVKGDPLCKWIFEQAGRDLAKHLLALYRGASEELLRKRGGLSVVCVGSVWKSWPLLKPGFVSCIESSSSELREFSLLRLSGENTAALGAVYIAARSVKFSMSIDYSSNYNVFHHYKANV